MEENGIWKEQWKVPAFMVDYNQRIRHRAIADIFQELANNHANFRKVGFEDMKASGKFWVLNRQAIQIDAWPSWEQPIKVETWISMMKGPFSLRNFAMLDNDNNYLILASYLWTSIDRKKKRPVAFPEGDFPVISDRGIELPEPHKFTFNDLAIESDTPLVVRNSDLDIIGHTNNAVYLEWGTDSLSNEEKNLRRIDANYVGESFEGDQINVQKYKLQNNTVLISISIQDGKEICRIKYS